MQVECEVRSADVERIGVDVLSSELQVRAHARVGCLPPHKWVFC